VVIVGGGFAGLFAARMLARAPVEVTLLDRAEHHLFQPMLYQCATGILSEGKIAAPLRQLLAKHRNIEFVVAEATGIDAERQRVLARRPLGKQVEFGYDYLILAAGVRQSYFGHDEYAPIAPGMKTIEDALKIRRRVFGAFEMAETAEDPAERARWLTFALVGAGPTGVELAGQIREVATKTLRDEYRHIKPGDARVLLFAQQDRAGRIVVGNDLRIPGHPEILVTGDVMSLDKLPGVAEVAMQTGLYAGRSVAHQARGQSFDKPFKYRDLGSAAYISRGKAVVSAFKMNFGGFLGWWVWLFIHIGFLTGYRNRVGAVLGWWFAFTRDLRRERTFTIDDMPVAAGPYGVSQPAPGETAAPRGLAGR
jgi:NADH dehydrogenase FAD-containing subunit